MKNENLNLFTRLDNLFNISLLKDSKVLIIGCGSGGGNVALQLVMSGIINFTLIDFDILEIENVIRHVCGRRFVGMKKTDALEEILQDRNPNVNIRKIDANIMTMDQVELKEEIKNASVVVMATDNEPSRFLINELCVESQTPHVTAKVFTRGMGGEVFSYMPNNGGCLACLESALERLPLRNGVKEIDLVSEDIREKMYGMEIPEIKDSPGLNIDISFITCFHTRFVLESIVNQLTERPKYMLPIDENYIVWGNRPIAPFTKNFQLQRVNVTKQDNCQVCSK